MQAIPHILKDHSLLIGKANETCDDVDELISREGCGQLNSNPAI